MSNKFFKWISFLSSLKHLLLFFLLIFSCNLIFAQNKLNLEIIKNKNFKVDEYKRWINIPFPSKYFNGLEDTIKNRIQLNLTEEGYFNFKIDSIKYKISIDSSFTEIKIYLDEGEPTFINAISILGLDSLKDANIFRKIKFLSGKIFYQSQIENFINEILNHLENNGYPFAEVAIKSVNFFSDSIKKKNYVDILIEVDKSLESKFDLISIEGNKNTKDYVIIRELDIQKGEPYSEYKLENIPSRLNKLRFFEPIQKPIYYFNSKDDGVLQINVKEKQTNNFDGIIGYIPANNEQDGYITGLVNINLRNIFGTGRAMSFRWQRINRNSQELELKYFRPYLFGFPINIQGGLFQKKQDTIYVQRKLDLYIDIIANQNITIGGILSTESVIPTENEFSVFTVYNSNLLSGGMNLRIDTRDDPYSPTKGILFNNSYIFTRKNINGPEKYLTPDLKREINYQKILVDLNFYSQFFNRQVVALELHGKELRGDLIEISDMFYLGGTNTLRGYQENQFLGSRIFWSNLEYRFLLSPRTFTFVFFDTGYFLRKADESRNIIEQSDFLIGYGFGLNIETALGAISVSYALAKGDPFNEGKIHFGLVNDF
ncbi:MAG: hypothetical protein STSR0008_14960 [Ignavibacterium sp.]